MGAGRRPPGARQGGLVRRKALVALVASLFAVALVESWEALTHAAHAAHVPFPAPWPHMVDGFILAMALMVVEARAQQRNPWWARVGMVGSTALSTVIQVAYAPPGGRWLAAWSPVAVLFSFECLVGLLYAQRAAAVAPVDDLVGSVHARELAPTPPARALTAAEVERVRRQWKRGADPAVIAERTALPVELV